MRLLDRYLFRSLAASLGVGVVLAVVALLGLQLLRLSDLIIRFDLSLIEVFRMMSGLAVSFTPLVIPIAFLFSVLSLFGRMNADREFIALKASGLSAARILRSCYLAAGAAAVLSLAAAFYLGPLGNRMFEISLDETFKKKVASQLRAGTFTDGFLGMLIFVDQVDPVKDVLQGIFIFDETTFKSQVSVSAKKGRWLQNEKQGLGVLVLDDGVLLSQDSERGFLRRMSFDEYRVNADFSREVGTARDSPPSLDLSDLMRRRAEASRQPQIDPRSTWVEMARRIALALACFCFVPLGFAVSASSSRTSKSRAVPLGLVILFSYWTVYFACVSWLLKTNWSWAFQMELVSYAVVFVPNILLLMAAYLVRVFRIGRGKALL